MAKAAEPGHSDVVSWLQNTEKQDERDDITTMKTAATNGKIELVVLVQWITEMARPHGFLAAASHGHVELLESMTEQYAIGASTTLGSLVKAAENGLLHVERWLIERDWNDEDLDSDSDNDDWDEYGVFGYPRGCYNINGHLEVTEYIRSRNNAPLNNDDEKKEDKRLATN
ncbi:Pre-mRNA-splicing factor 38B [Phytophthora cinnamomi]|uniref:Pre-mRNA-splicing factor 38B n=1 Tax=Phytophthora cinnamomi TaxID=4785 RepID=UPI003559E343|nr:Pre-mRNA-splicing factor 38B [Phytophthora cinnamomi]